MSWTTRRFRMKRRPFPNLDSTLFVELKAISSAKETGCECRFSSETNSELRLEPLLEL